MRERQHRYWKDCVPVISGTLSILTILQTIEFRDFEEIAVCTIDFDAGNIHDWPLMLELKRKDEGK